MFLAAQHFWTHRLQFRILCISPLTEAQTRSAVTVVQVCPRDTHPDFDSGASGTRRADRRALSLADTEGEAPTLWPPDVKS